MSLSMMLPGLVSGALQDMMGYRHFFTLSLVFSLLTLLVVGRLKIDKEFGKAEQEQGQGQEKEQEKEQEA
jgi:PAT family beta-lactamase induction signal transducer AmpG